MPHILPKHIKALIFALAISVFGCAEDANPKKNTMPEPDIPIHTIWDFTMTIMDSSRIKAVISSKSAVVNDKREETILDSSVKVEFMNNFSRRVGLLTADSAKIDDRTRNMFAYENVKVVSDSSHTVLTTRSLMWNNEKKRLFTTEKVHIVTPSEVIDGTGLESDQYLKNYKIFHVSGIKRIE